MLVEEEDHLAPDEPVIKPKDTKVVDLSITDEEKIPETTFNKTFLFGMTKMPKLIRNICFVGSLHSRKTSLIDMFIKSTFIQKQKV